MFRRYECVQESRSVGGMRGRRGLQDVRNDLLPSSWLLGAPKYKSVKYLDGPQLSLTHRSLLHLFACVCQLMERLLLK